MMLDQTYGETPDADSTSERRPRQEPDSGSTAAIAAAINEVTEAAEATEATTEICSEGTHFCTHVITGYRSETLSKAGKGR